MSSDSQLTFNFTFLKWLRRNFTTEAKIVQHILLTRCKKQHIYMYVIVECINETPWTHRKDFVLHFWVDTREKCHKAVRYSVKQSTLLFPAGFLGSKYIVQAYNNNYHKEANNRGK